MEQALFQVRQGLAQTFVIQLMNLGLFLSSVNESLAWRMEILHIHPLSGQEKQRSKKMNPSKVEAFDFGKVENLYFLNCQNSASCKGVIPVAFEKACLLAALITKITYQANYVQSSLVLVFVGLLRSVWLAMLAVELCFYEGWRCFLGKWHGIR